jgi:hypothetical protein
MNNFIYFKSPSKEKIEERLSKLSLEKRFELAVKNRNTDLIEQYISEGLDFSKINFSNMWVVDFVWLNKYLNEERPLAY